MPYCVALPVGRIKRCTPSVCPSVPCHSAKQESPRNFRFGVKFIVNIVLDKNNWVAYLISKGRSSRSQGTKNVKIVLFHQWKCFVFVVFVRNPRIAEAYNMFIVQDLKMLCF